MKQLKVTPIKWANVAGKETYYVKIENDKAQEYTMSIGEKSYKAIQELTEEVKAGIDPKKTGGQN